MGTRGGLRRILAGTLLALACLAPVGCGMAGGTAGSESAIQPPSGPPAAPGLPPTLGGATISARSGGTVSGSATFTPNLQLTGYNAIGFQHLTIDAISGAGQVLGLAYWTGTDYQFGNLTVPEINALGTTRGYWLFTSGPTSFTYSGNDLSGNRSVPLVFGWNMVTFPAQQDVQANTLQTFRGGQPVNPIAVIATDFFEINTNNQNVPVNVLAPGATLRAGRPYWVYAAEPVTLTYTVPVPTPTPLPSVIPTPVPTPTPSPVAPATGRLYVGADSVNRLLVFNGASSVNGNVPPSRTVSGAGTGLNHPSHLELDRVRDTIYVSNFDPAGTVLAFSPASSVSGDAAPVRRLTGLDRPSTLCFDSVHDRLYVAVDGPTASVLIIDNVSTKSGAVSPDRQLTNFPSIVRGIDLDVASDRLYVSCESNQIAIFDSISTKSGAQGGLVSRVVSGPATLMNSAAGLVYDAPTDQLYCASQNSQVLVYNNASTMNGNQAPARNISGSLTSLALPTTLRLDRERNELYVSNFFSRTAGPAGGQVLVFNNANTANGNVAPARILAGSNTGFDSPGSVTGIALDPQTPAPTPTPTPTPSQGGQLQFQELVTFTSGADPNFPAIAPNGRFIVEPMAGSNIVQVLTIDASGRPNFGSTFTTGGQPGGAAVSPNSAQTYVTNIASATVTAFNVNPTTGALTIIGSPLGTGGNPLMCAVHPSGSMLVVANAGSNTISRFRIQGDGSLVGVGNTTATGSGACEMVVFSPDGRHLYTNNGLGFSVDAGNIALTQLPGTPFPNFTSGGRAIAITPNGNFVYGYNGTLQAYSRDSNTGVLTLSGTQQTLNGGIIAIAPSGNNLYMTDANNNQVVALRIDPNTGAVSAVTGSPYASGASTGSRPSWPLIGNNRLYSVNKTNSVSTFQILP